MSKVNFYITYYSKSDGKKVKRPYNKSDGKKVKRPYNPHHEMQHEFIAKSTGNLCKRYWDESKNDLRTANAPWTIEPGNAKNK